MSINEQMVQDIVQDVLAKMQIASDVQGDRGVFKDMNEAIEAAKASQKIVAKMSLDHREKVISNIRKKLAQLQAPAEIRFLRGAGYVLEVRE